MCYSIFMTTEINWPILGHQKIQEYLQKSLKNGIIYPVYLFIGPKSVGKRTVAENFIKTLHCYAYDQDKNACLTYPCNECIHCQQLAKKIHPDHFDTILPAGKKQIPIEQVRELQNKLSAKAFLSGYKTALIENIDTLTTEAANALLKNLEEPSAKTVIILTTSHKENVLPTILSRCQLINFSPVSFEEIYDYLLAQKVEKDLARELALLSQGRPGSIIGKITELSKKSNFDTKKNFLKIFKTTKIPERLQYIENNFKDKNFDLAILDEWLSIIRDLLVSKLSLDNLVVNISFQVEIKNSLANLSLKRLVRALKQVQAARAILKGNVNQKLILENLIINI